MSNKAQNFDSILKSKVSDHLKERLSKITDGIIGGCRQVNNLEGQGQATIYNLVSPIPAYEKVGNTAPRYNSNLLQRIITPRSFASPVLIDEEDKKQLMQDPFTSLAEPLVMGLREAMQKHLVIQAFGTNILGPVGNSIEQDFSNDMIIKVDERLNKGAARGHWLDKILLASKKLQSNGVPHHVKRYLAVSPATYERMFTELKMTSKDYIDRVKLEQGEITHFAGFQIIVTNYLPGGTRQPTIYDADGKPTNTPVIMLRSYIDTSSEVKSHALFWAEGGLSSALWADGVNVKIGQISPVEGEFIYAECRYGATRNEESYVGYIEMEA
ncbi:MAG: hypothetical protein EU981_02195 [Candidatus Liberibacter ctenarytainae]|uniref:Uncharacterized protein n=1 Tax=Candidatus Liberibacter ctenarytainae TaxID=2020335 RepID=A0A937ALD1_9HYPH|nr:hypothetical protein [Candidatus Liberibacter ctenarytainae]